MVAETKIKVSGTWQLITQPEVRVSGTWREVQEIEVKVSGTWRTVFEIEQGLVTVSGEIITNADFGTVLAGVRFNLSGIVERNIDGNRNQIDSSTDWIIPNSSSSGPREFHIRALQNATSGSGTRVGTLNVWELLTSSREWTIQKSDSGIATWDLDIEISDDGGSTTLDTALYELTAQNLA